MTLLKIAYKLIKVSNRRLAQAVFLEISVRHLPPKYCGIWHAHVSKKSIRWIKRSQSGVI